jgi:hypothetical protein
MGKLERKMEMNNVIYQASDTKPETSTSGMRFQTRDGEILMAIYQRDGVMAKRQLKTLFWPDKTERAMEKRLSKLYRLGYLAWPTLSDWRTKPIPEPVCWLGPEGIRWVAAQSGVIPELPPGDNESRLRRLEVRLREAGVYWVREPRWIQLGHDLAVGDFRLVMEAALRRMPGLALEGWLHEGAFRSHMDVVEYPQDGVSGERKLVKKGVCPDSYFIILDQRRARQGQQARARFLLEMDMATHDNPSFGREKILPGVHYLLSPQYKARFGDNSGRWLVVTTGQRRLHHLKVQAETVAGKAAGVFYFATLDQLSPDTILTAPVWWRGGEGDPRPLLPN